MTNLSIQNFIIFLMLTLLPIPIPLRIEEYQRKGERLNPNRTLEAHSGTKALPYSPISCLLKKVLVS